MKLYTITDGVDSIAFSELSESIYAIKCFTEKLSNDKSKNIEDLEFIEIEYSKQEIENMNELMLDSDGVFKCYRNADRIKM